MQQVIFACVHNAGRSQMAAAFFNAMANPDAARAVSAGTAPAPRVHPEVVTAMGEVGIDLSGAVPQKLTDELAQGASLLITMGCGEQCPLVPHLRRDDWPLPDPRGQSLQEVRRIRDDIRGRVRVLLADEGWSAADGTDLQLDLAAPEDADSVLGLLATLRLPTEGLREHLHTTFVARTGNRIVGAAGLELHEDGALLRSVAVSPAFQGTGLARRLVTAVEALARTRNVPALYLLTTTAADYFPRLGFSPVERRDVPEGVQQSVEFRGACPASAIVMRKQLGR